MNVSDSLLNRSTYVYFSIAVYVCAFFPFVYIGLQIDDYKHLDSTSVYAVKDSNLFGDISDYTLKGIFINNLVYIIKNYVGIITFGVYPIILLFFNASFFGLIVGRVISEHGLNFVLIHTLPHSIELIAVVLAAADSMFLGVLISLKLLRLHDERIDYYAFFKNFVLYSIIILIAAFCEANISMKI